MKPTTATFVVLLAAVCLVRYAYADLPVHCLNVQVAGKWLFEMSADNGHPYNTRCGHKVPDTNLDHFTKRGFDLEVVKQYTVTLHEPNIAEDDQHNFGTWTMVYDEGFEVLINGRSFFAFSKYLPKSPESLSKDDVEDYISVCDETLVGWFHNNDNTHWGCYHGKKIANSTAARFRSTKIAPARRQDNTPVLAPSKEIMEHNRAARAAATKPSFIAFSKTTTSSNKADFQNLAHDVLFEPDISFIELHNSDNSKLWRAGVHRHLIGRRMSEMMTMLGYRKREADVSQKKPMKDRPKAVPDHRPDHIKYHVLPKSFDWRHQNGVNYDSRVKNQGNCGSCYDSRVKNQGNCGSCYAMATISVAEARVRIKSKMRDQTLLSSQAVVSCSIYNQGCDGGYPYLVAKHAMDFGLVPEACMEYTAENGECKLMRSKHCRDPKNPPRYFASNYSYIGGYYGACNEVKMMEELHENGPIMVAFDAPSSLFYYTGGIYTGEKPPQEDEHVPGLNIWEKTNHAVVAVGWGEDKGVKYWIIKNTWGEDWGENGYFRIRRGTDECGVESMASTLDMVLPEFESNTHR